MQPASTAQAEAQVIDKAAPAPLPQDALEEALERGRRHLMALQDSAGWWKAELETNVTMDAEDLLLREFLGIGDAAAIGRAANWIRSQQREDGTLGQLLRGARRPLHDRRGVRRAAARRRRAGGAPHGRRARVGPGRRRHRERARLHPYLARAVRPVVVGRRPGAAARADLPAAAGSRSTSTTSPAGRARRSSRSRSSAPSGRCARCPSASTSCAPARPVKPRPRTLPRARAPVARPRRCRVYERRPLQAAAAPGAGAGRALDRSSARRPTGPGAASSRPGSTR